MCWQVRDLVSATYTLRNKIKALEHSHGRMQETLRCKEAELKNYRRRERQFVAKLTAMQESEKARVQAANAAKADGAIVSAIIDEERLRDLLSGRTGQRVNSMLSGLQMTQVSSLCSPILEEPFSGTTLNPNLSTLNPSFV